jgi:hypothetical protein
MGFLNMSPKILNRYKQSIFILYSIWITPLWALSNSKSFVNNKLGSVSPSGGNLVAKLNKKNDQGFWFEQVMNKKLPYGWSVETHTEQRWGAGYRLFWYHEYHLNFQYDFIKQINKWFKLHPDNILKNISIGPAFTQYSQIQTNTRGKAKWVWVSRPILAGFINFKWKGWVLTNRLRGEYQQYNSPHYKDYGNGRYRIVLFTPLKITRYQINPYISNEFFFRSNTYHKTHPKGLVGGLYENRFRLGLAIDLWKDVFTAQIFWQWRPLKQKPMVDQRRWVNTYQSGLLLSLSF